MDNLEKVDATLLANRIVEAIKDDFTDRCGLRQVWDSMSDETQIEMCNSWRLLARNEITKEKRRCRR
jgi:hypothetical protein